MSDWPALQHSIEKTPDPYRPGFVSRVLRRLGFAAMPAFEPGIYIIAYHQIYDPNDVLPWERAYSKAATSVGNFRAHLELLMRHMLPLDLIDVPSLLAKGEVDAPYFVLTFDDGYKNLMANVAPLVAAAGLPATVFVNGAATESWVYYRVLASILVERGFADRLASALKLKQPDQIWEGDAKHIFDLTKNQYRPWVTEAAVDEAYRSAIGDPAELGVHLSAGDMRALAAAGWRIGSHGWDHVILNELDEAQIAKTHSDNVANLSAAGIELCGWYAIPNGRAKHVNRHVREWLGRQDGLNACFCGGGVNLRPTRTQWLRIGVGDWTAEYLAENLRREARVTRVAIAALRDEADFS